MDTIKITRETLLTIQDNEAMRPYVKTEKQRMRWLELLMTDFPIYRDREKKIPAIANDGKPIVKRKTFEGARLAYFEEFYGFGKELRAIELEALEIFGKKIEEAAPAIA